MSKSDDDTGYKRPPIKTRFKKGQSGNPKGRPKGVRNFKTDVKETLGRSVRVNEGGRLRNISAQQASLLRLCEKAVSGDLRAVDRILELAERLGDEETAARAEGTLSEQEAEILADYTARIREQVIAEIAREAAARASTDDTSQPQEQTQTTDQEESE